MTCAPHSLSLSQWLAKARMDLMTVLHSQLDELLTDNLKPEAKGLPFKDCNGDPPQLEAIKKIINCLYYAEHTATNLEQNPWLVALTLPHIVATCSQLHESIAQLDNVIPELLDYCTALYQLIVQPNWLSPLQRMRTNTNARTLIDLGIELLGPGFNKDSETAPLLAAVTKMTRIIQQIELGQTQDPSNENMELFCSLLKDLDNNLWFRKYSYEQIKEYHGFKAFMNWVTTVQEEGIKSTPNTLQTYITWVNTSYPKLLLLIDQLELQHYLKAGVLSDPLITTVDKMTQDANKQLTAPPINSSKTLITTQSLQSLRDHNLHEQQVQCVQKILSIMNQEHAALEFYSLLAQYKGHKLSHLSEKDKLYIISIYPKFQCALAQINPDLEYTLTHILKKTKPSNFHKIHWSISGALSTEVTELLNTRNVLINGMNKRIDAEKLKIQLVEKAREKLTYKPGILYQTPLSERVQKRIQEIKASLPEPALDKKGQRDQLEPIPTSQLITIRGHLVYLQELKISQIISNTRQLLTDLIPHYPAPEAIQYIQQTLNGLHHLEHIFLDFEQLDSKSTILEHFSYVLRIRESAQGVWSSVKALEPAYKKHIKPLLDQITLMGHSTYRINSKKEDKEDKDTANTFETVYKPIYAKPIQTIQKARNELLTRCKNTLSAPITRLLKDQKEGMPFIELEEDPPQV
ncbi:MAG: hypothetical protein ACHP6H_05430, partial [Legionellales bacterium]